MINTDGTVTALTGKCEMGQGLYTAQTQLVAEELGVEIASREADSVHHRRHARSGGHVRRAIASAEFQSRESRACRGHRARGAAADGVKAMGRACGSPDRRQRRRASWDTRCQLRRADRREAIQSHAQSVRQAQSAARVDDYGQSGQATRYARDGDRPFRVRAQRARAWHGARPRRPAADRRRDRGECRRKLRQRYARLHQSRDQERFRRRRL